MKIYTGSGDHGKTSLFSGERVLKSSSRITAYGDLDELNSVIGAVAAAIDADQPMLKAELLGIQGMLLGAGAWLATTPNAASVRFLKPFTHQEIERLETAIDQMSAVLPELKQFILPGGHLSAALAHVARTVCRRAERHVIEWIEAEKEHSSQSDTINHIMVFLNRLSDYLFVLARYCNHVHHREDIVWKT